MNNLSTKFEVSMFTHYEDKKGKAKCKNWGGFWQLGVIQSRRQPDHPIERIRLLIGF